MNFDPVGNHDFASDQIAQNSLFPPRFPFTGPVSPKFSFIDLFAGIGGFRLALQEIGGECVFTSEFNPSAQTTYYNNFGDFPKGDITKINPRNIPEHDILAAGFPCQPFSISGKMKGFEDSRGTLIYNILSIIELRLPKLVLLENVKHLIHHNRGETLKFIIDKIQGFGYFVCWNLLNATDFGVPQNRERVILVCSRKAEFDFSLLRKTKSKPLKYFLENG